MEGAFDEVDGFEIVEFATGEDSGVGAAPSDFEADIESVWLGCDGQVSDGGPDHEVSDDFAVIDHAYVSSVFGEFSPFADDVDELSADVCAELEVGGEVKDGGGAQVEGHGSHAGVDAAVGGGGGHGASVEGGGYGVGFAIDDAQAGAEHDGELEEGVAVLCNDFVVGQADAVAGEDGGIRSRRW